MESIHLKIDGSSCGSCVAPVTRGLGGAPRQACGCCGGH